MPSCAVLGRGKSLLRFPDFVEKIDKIYLVNDFNDELKMLGLKLFKYKKMMHVVGRGPNQLKDKYFENLGIKKIISNAPGSFDFPDRYPIRVKF